MRLMKKRGKDKAKILLVVRKIALNQYLPKNFNDHQLSGKYQGCRECHVEPDWLLVYRLGKNGLELVETGTHADLY